MASRISLPFGSIITALSYRIPANEKGRSTNAAVLRYHTLELLVRWSTHHVLKMKGRQDWWLCGTTPAAPWLTYLRRL